MAFLWAAQAAGPQFPATCRKQSFRRAAETNTRNAGATGKLKQHGSQIGCRLRFSVASTF
ncbi:MAG: hypothetical protein DME43_11560 [Verrucomicrobia bacterium]|nr:MAG: hypothetical protein DME43_11560 [Verrucomicrobiota bacterium]